MENVFTHTFHIPGTLAANVIPVVSIPFDCSLVHVSAVASNTNDATLKVGSTLDDDAFVSAFAIGDGNVPVVKSRKDFVEGQYPHLPAGTNLMLTLDYDGAGGTAAQNVTIVLTFTKG
ncbi:MAG: hypothetical protein ACPL3P_05890 [Anaerolineales bacterium]